MGQTSCAALGYTTILNTLCNLKVLNAAAMNNSSIIGGDYKAMVCILLSGGNDSFNMLIPNDTNAYNDYSIMRSNLAIPKNDLNNLNGVNFGTHPSMTGIANLYNSNKLSFISNIGTLIEPISSKYELWNGAKRRPLGLFSHSDQAQQWQTSVPHDRSAVGWGGKISDLMRAQNSNDKISMNISLSGGNVFQRGNDTVEYAINAYDGSIGIYGYEDTWLGASLRNQAIDNMIEAQYNDMFKQAYVDVVRISRDADIQFSAALEQLDPLSTNFSDNYLSESMHMIAKTIASRETLGLSRQIFFVDYGGWDHHDEVLDNQTEMLGIVSAAMEEFNSAVEELNIEDCVTTFTMSEFGRTLTSNGNGTDHGWGGNVMVMGGPVNGGQMYGNYPELKLNSDIETGGGVFIPSLSADEYFAELALWFGVSPSDLVDIFPNIGNFYSPGSSDLPIGFLNV